MAVFTESISYKTKGEGDIVDLTGDAAAVVTKSGVENGIVIIFVPGSTAGITTIEYEDGLIRDFPAMLERIAPRDTEYLHEKRWRDGNGRSHVKASLLKPDLTVPFVRGELITGTWQQIVLVELDIRSRVREVIYQVLGE